MHALYSLLYKPYALQYCPIHLMHATEVVHGCRLGTTCCMGAGSTAGMLTVSSSSRF